MKLLSKILFLGLSISFVAVTLTGCAKGKKEPGVPIIVKATVDKTTAAIGDKIKYTIFIEKDKDIEIEPSFFGKNLGNFAVKDFGSKKSESLNKDKIFQWYILDTYITGKTTIPKATIKYKRKKDNDWSQVETGQLSVEVKSSLDKGGPNVQMRDIKDPVGLHSAISKYFIFAGVLFLIALGLSGAYFMKRNKEGLVVPKKPAHEIAYEQLEQLRAKDYIDQGLIKEYYTEISDIIRHYLENRFELRAPEMTTEEFLVSARDAAKLISEHKNLLKEFLLCCDLVKFAKYAPPADETNSIFNSAKNFIDQTKENEPA
jgi:hypothetical protein